MQGSLYFTPADYKEYGGLSFYDMPSFECPPPTHPLLRLRYWQICSDLFGLHPKGNVRSFSQRMLRLSNLLDYTYQASYCSWKINLSRWGWVGGRKIWIQGYLNLHIKAEARLRLAIKGNIISQVRELLRIGLITRPAAACSWLSLATDSVSWFETGVSSFNT